MSTQKPFIHFVLLRGRYSLPIQFPCQFRQPCSRKVFPENLGIILNISSRSCRYVLLRLMMAMTVKNTRERHRILTCLSVTLLIPFTVRIFLSFILTPPFFCSPGLPHTGIQALVFIFKVQYDLHPLPIIQKNLIYECGSHLCGQPFCICNLPQNLFQ